VATNIHLDQYSPLRKKWYPLCCVRDLTPHVGRIIYFHVIKVNINKDTYDDVEKGSGATR
jgi:hypothetical protein